MTRDISLNYPNGDEEPVLVDPVPVVGDTVLLPNTPGTWTVMDVVRTDYDGAERTDIFLTAKDNPS